MKLSRTHLILSSAALVILLSGAGVAAYHLTRPAKSQPSQANSTPAPTSTPPKTSSSQPTAADATAPQTTQSTATSAPTQPTPQPRPAPPPSYQPPHIPLMFSAGRIETAYTSCGYGTLYYTIGGVTISVNQLSSAPFTWQIELSDGTVFESGTDVMPAGKQIWYSFPSTPDYPSMIGTIENAEDGDMARLVITKPNYSAGGWSTPVPAGSVESCRNGQM